MIRRIVATNASYVIVAVFIQGTPRRLQAILDGAMITTSETDSGVVFDPYEYCPRTAETEKGETND